MNICTPVCTLSSGLFLSGLSFLSSCRSCSLYLCFFLRDPELLCLIGDSVLLSSAGGLSILSAALLFSALTDEMPSGSALGTDMSKAARFSASCAAAMAAALVSSWLLESARLKSYNEKRYLSNLGLECPMPHCPAAPLISREPQSLPSLP